MLGPNRETAGKQGSAEPERERLLCCRSYGLHDGVAHQPDDQEDDQPHHDASENSPRAIAGREVARITADILDEPVVAHVARNRRGGGESREGSGETAAHECDDVPEHPEATAHEALSVPGAAGESPPRHPGGDRYQTAARLCACRGRKPWVAKRAVAPGRLVAWAL